MAVSWQPLYGSSPSPYCLPHPMAPREVQCAASCIFTASLRIDSQNRQPEMTKNCPALSYTKAVLLIQDHCSLLTAQESLLTAHCSPVWVRGWSQSLWKPRNSCPICQLNKTQESVHRSQCTGTVYVCARVYVCGENAVRSKALGNNGVYSISIRSHD